MVYRQLLDDVLAFCNTIKQHLSPDLLVSSGVIKDNGVYICILVPLSYDFIVVLGGAAVALSTKALPEEATWLMDKCHSACLLVGSEQTTLAREIHARRTSTDAKPVPPILIQTQYEEYLSQIFINTDITFPVTRPGLVLFTSGTTGPPKGVVLPRQFFFPHVALESNDNDIAMVYRPTNCLSGVLNLMDLIYVGARAELFPNGAQAEPMWERLRQGGITMLAGAPHLWQVLMAYHEEKLAQLSAEEIQPYHDAVKRLRIVWFGGGMPSPAAKRFWLRLRSEKPWLVKYGSTELGREAMTFPFSAETNISEPIIGRPLPAVSVKLNPGDHSELLIKSPTMLIGYLDDEERTQAAFNDEGYYRTGDLVHLNDGGNYVIDGRASADFVRFYGLRVPVYEVESHLSELPYISEAYILCVPDSQYGQRVGALVKLQQGTAGNKMTTLTLGKLRQDLSDKLSTYKQPTLLWVLTSDEEFPTSPQGKLAKKEAMQLYFPNLSDTAVTQLPPEVEVWEFDTNELRPQKTWDWGGVSH